LPHELLDLPRGLMSRLLMDRLLPDAGRAWPRTVISIVVLNHQSCPRRLPVTEDAM